jgi:hypothetical protein
MELNVWKQAKITPPPHSDFRYVGGDEIRWRVKDRPTARKHVDSIFKLLTAPGTYHKDPDDYPKLFEKKLYVSAMESNTEGFPVWEYPF